MTAGLAGGGSTCIYTAESWTMLRYIWRQGNGIGLHTKEGWCSTWQDYLRSSIYPVNLQPEEGGSSLSWGAESEELWLGHTEAKLKGQWRDFLKQENKVKFCMLNFQSFPCQSLKTLVARLNTPQDWVGEFFSVAIYNPKGKNFRYF